MKDAFNLSRIKTSESYVIAVYQNSVNLVGTQGSLAESLFSLYRLSLIGGDANPYVMCSLLLPMDHMVLSEGPLRSLQYTRNLRGKIDPLHTIEFSPSDYSLFFLTLITISAGNEKE